MKIACGICSWGLGHATRSLPIIRRFLDEGDEVTIVSWGSALRLLRDELDGHARFMELQDYHPPATDNPKAFALNTVLNLPTYLNAMRREHRFVERMLARERFDAIYSDNRFGFYSVKVPSFFMTHQLRIMNPLHIQALETGTERFNRWILDRLAGVLVPDFKENGLAGKLAHGLSVIDEDSLSYIGVLSDFRPKEVEQDIDIFVSISGFEPQRSSFERLIMQNLADLDGKIVVSLGKRSRATKRGNLTVHGITPRATQEELLNRARMVVARSGYSTMMDLCALGKRSLLAPTPGQTEQEYLAEYHKNRGNYFCVSEKSMDIASQMDDVMSLQPPRAQHSIEQSVENAVGVITGTCTAC